MLRYIVLSVSNFQTQWDDSSSTPITRLWCLLELFVASILGHKLNIAICEKRSRLIYRSVSKEKSKIESVEEFFAGVNIRNARTFSRDYDNTIWSYVEQCGGLDFCDGKIKDLLSTCKKASSISTSSTSMMHSQQQQLSLPFIFFDLDGT